MLPLRICPQPPARHGLQTLIHSAHLANLVVGIRALLGTLREIHLTGINKGRQDQCLILVLMAKNLGEEHGVSAVIDASRYVYSSLFPLSSLEPSGACN